MNKTRILSGIVTLAILAMVCNAGEAETRDKDFFSDIWERETLSDGFFGLNDELSSKGIEINLGVTNIYQQNVRGGISKHRRAGRLSGSYDLELSADLE